jgi:hypothetical protein
MRGYRFRLSPDVRRYFASIEQTTLQRLFARRLDVGRTLSVIARLLAAGGAVCQTPLARSLPGFAADPVAPACCLERKRSADRRSALGHSGVICEG